MKTLAIRNNTRLRQITFSALTVSLSFVLGMFKIFKMPQGGSVSMECLPLLLAGLILGPASGFNCGALLGVIRSMTDGFVVHPVQMLLDYPLAFGCMGISGFARGRRIRFQIMAVGAGFLMRYLCHVVSGVFFFSSYAPVGTPALTYSLIYNSFLFFEFILTIAVWISIRRRLEKALAGVLR
ncbi:MAG: energy-coupled thiamine transporter ThiT [Candidatus Wallbacteria bacterium]|nr:energy-coupled thiamine transporter ThiT [Candidatus Wallbacteria bacterium]